MVTSGRVAPLHPNCSFKGMNQILMKCYSVSEITDVIRPMLEDSFPDVTIEGEISNFRPSSTGHLYFSLKDTRSVISVVMFRNRASGLGFQPLDGMVVQARGSISVYAKRGTYQLICERLTQSGEGDILAMLEERKRRLAAEGLFDPDRKKKLPLLPSRVAVVTSPTGAAVRDILRVLKSRHAGIDSVILPSPVQGDEAAQKICRQLRVANWYHLGDVIIVARGGGSLEDLLPFYEECVVRAIAESAIPVISAVGHEVDITLIDLVADVRAPTPSAAAEMVTASRDELDRRVRTLRDQLTSTLAQQMERARLQLAQFTVDNLIRFMGSVIQPLVLRLDDLREDLLQATSERIKQQRHRLQLVVQGLESHSPLDILRKGYAIVTHEPTSNVLASTDAVSVGDPLKIRLHKGSLRADVQEIEPHEEF